MTLQPFFSEAVTRSRLHCIRPAFYSGGFEWSRMKILPDSLLSSLPTRVFRECAKKIKPLVFEGEERKDMPLQEEKKPVLVIEIKDFLASLKWNLLRMQWDVKTRKHAGVFLFHLSNYYEIILVSSLPASTGQEVLRKVDPYGCVTHALFAPGKMDVEDMRRDGKRLVRINSKRESRNDLVVDKWNGGEDEDLLGLTDFLLSLNHVNVDDWRGVLDSYRDKRFSSAYEKVQKRLYFPGRRLFLFKADPQPQIHAANSKRIEEYERAKEYIENQLRLSRLEGGSRMR
jgi:NLI interacting factor-like phosphatase